MSSTPPDSKNISSLRVMHLSEVSPQAAEEKWLLESLWLHCGVGFLGGLPKLCKTFLACEIACAIASGTKALGRFETKTQGPVLFFGAEDSLNALRVRFDGLLAVRQLSAPNLPLYLIDTHRLRLDDPQDLFRLRGAVEKYQPRLLVLDPFVRMTTIDENAAAEVSAVLGSLRQLQRDFQLAILVVHHSRKSPAAHFAQSLRGSSDFAAWSDTNLGLSRLGKHLALAVEHRSAPAPEPLILNLAPQPAPHLVIVEKDQRPSLEADPLQTELLEYLSQLAYPAPTLKIREKLGRRKSDVLAALELLRSSGKIQRTPQGWLVNQSA